MQSSPYKTPVNTNAIAVILAAGVGKRMGSDLPKVLLPFHGRPMIQWVVETAQAAGIPRVIVVVGHKGEAVIESLVGYPVEFVWQREQLGTGHAVLQASEILKSHFGSVLVLLGDVPALRPETITTLLSLHADNQSSATILTAELSDPSGYGRVVRSSNGSVEAIVEDRDATGKLKSIKEINTGLIAFDCVALLGALGGVGKDNSQGEYYLTDAVKVLVDNDLRVMAYMIDDPEEATGVNSQDQLDDLERLIGPPR